MNYAVKQGDCMASIAQENGFFWQTLWSLGENAALKAKRKNPNVLLAGDTVYIPDIRVKQEARASAAKYKFVRKGVPEKLRMKLTDANHKPRPNLDYIITIDGKSHRGKTDATGQLTESIPPNAKAGRIVIVPPNTPPSSPTPSSATGTGTGTSSGKGTGKTSGKGAGKSPPPPPKPRKEIIKLNLGHLDPVSEISGVKGRLMNLKLYRGPLDSKVDDNTTLALKTFQSRNGLPVTGQPDDATKALLQKLHGH